MAHCLDKAGFCVLAWVPEAATDEAAAHVTTLQALTKRLSNINMVYIDANAQRAFVDAVGGNADVAGLTVLHVRKGRMVSYLGALSADAVVAFLGDITVGKAKSAALPKLPNLVAQADAQPSCDGGQAGGSDAGQCTAPPKGKTEL